MLGTMRLEDLEGWIKAWALPEMYAGVPGRGATDVWREALTAIEDLKLSGKNFCEGVADIAKFFDQIWRELVFKIAEAAGMPPGVLRAYKAYIDNFLVYNCLAGGVGTPHYRKAAYRKAARSR